MVLDPPTKPHQVPDLRQRDVRETVTVPKSIISYYSIPAVDFIPTNPDTDQVELQGAGEEHAQADANIISFSCAVHLPNGAIITACAVYGNPAATAETWTLRRSELGYTDGSTTMATANIGTQDTSITVATIDNSLYCYYIDTSTLDTGDQIWNARIRYTTT